MNKLYTIAEFPNIYDVKLQLLKSMLDEAGIGYLVFNENERTVKPMVFSISNISIEVKVYEDELEKALEILHSIQ